MLKIKYIQDLKHLSNLTVLSIINNKRTLINIRTLISSLCKWKRAVSNLPCWTPRDLTSATRASAQLQVDCTKAVSRTHILNCQSGASPRTTNLSFTITRRKKDSVQAKKDSKRLKAFQSSSLLNHSHRIVRRERISIFM